MEANAIKNLKLLFCYIRALSERRFVTATNMDSYTFLLSFDSLPVHSSVTTPFSHMSEDGLLSADNDIILCVGKAEQPAPPRVPRPLIGWLAEGWDNPFNKLNIIEKHMMPSADSKGQVEELFSDDSERVEALAGFKLSREQWVSEAIPAAASRDLYDKLYLLYAALGRERDAVELILGDGILETTLEDGTKVCHPLILERVSLNFNSNVPCFTVVDCDSPAQLYTQLLRMIPGLQSSGLSDYSAKIETDNIHPYETDRFNSFISSLANTISSDCELIGKNQKSAAKYTIKRGLYLFKRPRASGYSAMLDKIIEDIDVSPEMSESLLSIVGGTAAAPVGEVKVGVSAMDVNGISTDVLLEKAANREQLLIAKKLETNPAVLVQGPPGTGKTHTISNIIGDLLAQGKSVLVTSQTSKALSVLRDKISEPIRPLCVSVLDDNRRQLEESLRVINEMTSSNSIDSLDIEALRFKKERDSLIAELGELKTKLTGLVESEYLPIEIGGTSYSPKEAAQLIGSMSGEAFIPDSLPIDATLPLTAEQLDKLYGSNLTLTAEDEALLSSGAPDSSELIAPSRFAQICGIIVGADEGSDKSNAQPTAPSDSLWSIGTQRDAAVLLDLGNRIKTLRSTLSAADSEPWKLNLAQIGCRSDSVYEHLATDIPALKELAASLSLDIIDSAPHIPNELVDDNSVKIFNEIVSELDVEKINWLTVALHPKWKQLLDKCIINGEKPDTVSEVKILLRYTRLLLGRKQLLRRWESAVVALGGPALTGDAPEEQATLAWSTVTQWLKLYESTWLPIVEQLKSLGFDWDRYIAGQPLEQRMAGEISAMRAAIDGGISELVEEEYFKGDRSECVDSLERLSRTLLPFADKFRTVDELRRAVSLKDTEKYKEYYDKYDTVCLKREQYTQRLELLDTLRSFAPQWADAIAARDGLNGKGQLPGELDKNLLRARLCGALDERCGTAVSDTQKRIDELTSHLSTLTRELISRKAWSAQLRTMLDPDKKRALETWATLVKRLGKGTGKRAELLLASGELRRAMKQCRRAVPVWIMPISAVAENFEPSDEKFDVLIIDEASQADLTALIALYLAKKVIVVGDDKQVSPTPIGLDLDTANKLRQEFLTDVPAASMYDELVSIYDLGRANYQPITLREHFRCADDIISFSNYYTYNGVICPLRDSGSIKLHPSVVPYHVEGASASAKKTNKKEAESIAALIAACIEQPEYKGKSFGVITMLGDEQALMIDRILRRRLSENVYQAAKILCGNPSYFQGDERDVIFISLVDSSKEDGSALAVRREGYNEMYAKRYNVAASRARDQMWVVYSMDPDTDLKSDDIRLSLIRHALDPSATAKALEKHQPSALSDMEKAVVRILTDGGFNVTTRHKVGSYTVALTCEGLGGRLAIECDGDGVCDIETITDQLNKQSVLERLGWRFLRLRATEFYRDAAAFAAGLLNAVDAAGIKPGQAKTGTASGELTDRVSARAKELLDEWKERGSDDGESTETAEDNSAAADSAAVLDSADNTDQAAPDAVIADEASADSDAGAEG